MNKYARDQRRGISSQCRYIQCWTGPEQHRSRSRTRCPAASSFRVTVSFDRSPGCWWQQVALVTDQAAPAHHSHSRSYRPSYSATPWGERRGGQCCGTQACRVEEPLVDTPRALSTRKAEDRWSSASTAHSYPRHQAGHCVNPNKHLQLPEALHDSLGL